MLVTCSTWWRHTDRFIIILQSSANQMCVSTSRLWFKGSQLSFWLFAVGWTLWHRVINKDMRNQWWDDDSSSVLEVNTPTNKEQLDCDEEETLEMVMKRIQTKQSSTYSTSSHERGLSAALCCLDQVCLEKELYSSESFISPLCLQAAVTLKH